jgi:leucyl aminopeptidase
VSPLSPLALTGVEVLALPVLPAEGDDGSVTLGPGAAEVFEALDLDAFAVLEALGATGKAGEVFTHVVTDRSGIDNDDLRLVAFVGVGAAGPDDLRRAGAGLARALAGRQSVVTTVPAVGGADLLEAFVVGAMLGSFGFHWKSEAPERGPVARIVLADTPADQQEILERAVAIGGASWRARVLATVPANLKNPEWLADQARAVAAAAGLTCTVLDERELAKQGFGGLVAVGQASATPPRLIRLDYAPAGSSKAPHLVLVGKGITFDSGGLSIKPGEAMVTMKRDMTGGGVVISVLAALAAVGCPIRVTGLVAAAENAIGGAAFRPGDVIRHYGGRTTEVTNTDAEGRLVLADALAYAVAELAPDAVVDIATLTGAMKVAMGQRTGGYFANDDALAAAIGAAGAASGEPLWRFPLADDYEDKLTSKVADADNGAGNPGAITAALFLQHFTGSVPWAHLDIASVGDSPTETFEWSKGPTGFGARLLLHWLGGASPLEGIA